MVRYTTCGSPETDGNYGYGMPEVPTGSHNLSNFYNFTGNIFHHMVAYRILLPFKYRVTVGHHGQSEYRIGSH